jgi:hypothetical protein
MNLREFNGPCITEFQNYRSLISQGKILPVMNLHWREYGSPLAAGIPIFPTYRKLEARYGLAGEWVL